MCVCVCGIWVCSVCVVCVCVCTHPPPHQVERSSLIVATAIQQRPAAALVAEEQIERIAQFNPGLLAEES